MAKEIIEAYKKAGRIASEALSHGKSLIKPGASVIEICDSVEAKIRELGGGIAFPAQISLNDTAAHFCPEDGSDVILSDEVACIDVGVQIDGFIGDTACTVDLSGNNSEIVKASREALDAALKMAVPNTKLCEIGKTINETLASVGFNPVRNLSGHGLGRYMVHMAPTVPNYDDGDETVIEEGDVIAIEPFATNGNGMITEKGDPSVFTLIAKKPVRIGFVREIQNTILGYNGLPFTTRWLTRKFSEAQVRFALNQFKQLGILHEYPPLVEKTGGIVSQAEHSVIVGDKPFVFTRPGL